VFSRAQEHWREIATCDGFRGQLGGWSARQADRAWIVGFWRDQIALDRFMQDEHDAIMNRSKQSGMYTSIRVTFVETDEIAPPLANVTELRTTEQTIEFVRHGELIMLVALRSNSLDADTVLIEPAWTVEPKG